jgi:Uma2 family endonuclease
MSTAAHREGAPALENLNELNTLLRDVELPCLVRFYGVTEEMFDRLVNEDTQAELLDGVLFMHSPASPRHGDIGCFLLTLMRLFAAAKKVGKAFGMETLVHLAAGRMVAPDIFFFVRRRVPRPLPKKQFEGTPDLVAEILSPSNRDEDLYVKRPAYQDAGVGEIWLVDPEGQTVTVDLRRRKRYSTTVVSAGRIHSTVLPGFWVEAEWLWSDPLPDEMECLQKILG